MKNIIFRADDLGFSEGVNCGIEKAVKDGKISCVGFMVNMPAIFHGYRLIKDYDVAMSVHCNICAGRPVSDPKDIPSLVTSEGEFCSSREIRSRKEDTIVLEEAEREVEAQLKKFIEITGKKPDYFEFHAVFSKTFIKAVENIAKKYDLFFQNGMDEAWGEANGIKSFPFQRVNPDSTYDVKQYFLDNTPLTKENDCTLVIFHPGYLDQYILEHSSYTLIRPLETEFLCSEWLENWLKENDLKVVDFRNYKD